MKAKEEFKQHRRVFARARANSIIVRFGVQKGPDLLMKALQAKHKLRRWGEVEFPPQLLRETWWLDELDVGEAEDLDRYASQAASLAYRYLRSRKK